MIGQCWPGWRRHSRVIADQRTELWLATAHSAVASPVLVWTKVRFIAPGGDKCLQKRTITPRSAGYITMCDTFVGESSTAQLAGVAEMPYINTVGTPNPSYLIYWEKK